MKKRKTPKSIKTILEKVQGYSLSKLFSNQPTKFYSVVTETDGDQVIVKTADFYLTIQCSPENGTKKDLYKNLIKSPV